MSHQDDPTAKLAAMNAAIGGLSKVNTHLMNWEKINSSAATSALQTYLSKTLRNAGIFNMAMVPRDPVQRIIKGTMFGNADWLKAISKASANQHMISEAITKSLRGLGSLHSSNTAISKALIGNWHPDLFKSVFSGLQSTMQGVNARIAIKGISGIEPGFWDKLTSTTTEAATLTEEIVGTEYATKEDLAKLQTFIEDKLLGLQQNIAENLKKFKKPSRFQLLDFWVTLISLILSVVAMYQSCQSDKAAKDPKAVTQADLNRFKNFVDEKFQLTMGQITILAEARVNFNLRSKSSRNSKGFFRVSKGQTLNVLESNHKWARVAIINSEDKLPVTGWIEKKYLIRK